jgi:aerobic-type carbon monoxide dehydrogenase small subunit (CoxS/CutS family)
MVDTHRLEFVCNDAPVTVRVAAGESLLSVLREHLGLRAAKDGCAPQGQCGCCTVLVDGHARVACVTPATRVAGRRVTTLEGLEAARRDALAAAFVDGGASQCGFCTPGILLRAAALQDAGRHSAADAERALSAHLCRCTGWRSVVDAVTGATPAPRRRDLDAAAARAAIEGGVRQRVGPDVPLGAGGFADDGPPPDALVAVPRPPGSSADSVDASGQAWVVADTLSEARALAAPTPGRRSTRTEAPPLALPAAVPGGVRLATSWVEPAYLEPDASWCQPGGTPASPLANGGAFGGKTTSLAPAAAAALSAQLGRPVRVVYAREDVVRLGPKRPPIAAHAVARDGVVHIDGRAVTDATTDWAATPDALTVPAAEQWQAVRVPGPPTTTNVRAFPLAERTMLREAALATAGIDAGARCVDERVARTRVATVAAAPGGGIAGAAVHLDAVTGALASVEVRVAAGDPLDEVVLRSYCQGAAHMALGWVLTEGLAVDPESGEVLDLTIRSFGILRARSTPPLEVTVLDDAGPPRAVSDAVFAAVASAAWEALTAAEGVRPEVLPAGRTRTAQAARA